MQGYGTYRVMDAESGIEIAGNVRLAGSLWDRLRGLTGIRSLEPGSGLWLSPCNGIHTFGMRFPIDVVLLDRHNRVLEVVSALRPNRLLMPRRGGFSTLELPAGSTSGIQVGTTLQFELI